MKLSRQERRAKLEVLAESEGFDEVDLLLEEYVTDSVAPGICRCLECDYTAIVEPDQRQGWCERCNAPTVMSALILAELM